jgi:uncharacterized protein
MAAYRMRITAGAISSTATLSPNRTARAIWNALPLVGSAKHWGDELYFEVPIDLAEDETQEEVAVGDVAYWPPGNAVCIFWGPTPASHAREPRAASPVNVFGHIASGAKEFAQVKPGAVVRLERLP